MKNENLGSIFIYLKFENAFNLIFFFFFNFHISLNIEK